jgi:hypothetical protein
LAAGLRRRSGREKKRQGDDGRGETFNLPRRRGTTKLYPPADHRNFINSARGATLFMRRRGATDYKTMLGLALKEKAVTGKNKETGPRLYVYNEKE